MLTLRRLCIVPPLLTALLTAPLAAQTPALDPAVVAVHGGTRILAGGGKLPKEVIARFVELAGGANAHIVLIPTASQSADDPAEHESLKKLWREERGAEVQVLHTRDRASADDEAFCAPLRAATGVWLGGGAQKRIADAYLGTRVEKELMALLARGGVIGGTSAGTAIQTRTMIQEGKEDPIVATGFDFVPGAISDQHFLKRERLPRLLKVLTAHPGLFGIGVDESTAVEVLGDGQATVLGASKALFVLAAANGRPEIIVELKAGERTHVGTWRAAALDRTTTKWPPVIGEPRVVNGSLVLVGAGEIPDAAVQRFVQLAGGKEAKIVVVRAETGSPFSESVTPPDPKMLEALRRCGLAKGLAKLETVRISGLVEDGEAAAWSEAATAIWFDGGSAPLRELLAQQATAAAIRGVLARGGVLGGRAEGASMLGALLVRGNQFDVPALRGEGDWRGLSLLPACAIDPLFEPDDAASELRGWIGRLPKSVGIGLGAGGAAAVHGSELEVLTGKVAIFTAPAGSDTAPKGGPVWLEPAARFDLATGKTL